VLSRYIRNWGGEKLHIGLSLPQKDNLKKEDKALLPKCPLFGSSTVLPCPPWARSCKMAVKCPHPHYRQQHISTNSSIWKHNDFPKPRCKQWIPGLLLLTLYGLGVRLLTVKLFFSVCTNGHWLRAMTFEWVWFESWICWWWLQRQLGEVYSIKTKGSGEYAMFNGPISLKWPLENLFQWLIG